MPDWTYQTVFRPALRQLPFPFAQKLVFRSMGLLGRTAIGRSIVGFMGHAKAPLEAIFEKAGLEFPGRCGLACGVDLSVQAVSAISLFGFGLIEVGPVRAGSSGAATPQWRERGLVIPGAAATLSVGDLREALEKNSSRSGVPVFARVLVDADVSIESLQTLAQELEHVVDGFSVAVGPNVPAESDEMQAVVSALKSGSAKLLVILDIQSHDELRRVKSWNHIREIDGWVLECGIDETGSRGLLADEVVSSALDSVESFAGGDEDRLLVVSGAVEEPIDGLRLLNAGADIVLVDSGFAVAGPGLPKRINAAVRAHHLCTRHSATDNSSKVPFTHRSWFWGFLLGLGLAVGGLVAMVIGWTRVVLPYDEEFLGMFRDEICSLNPQLLPFMSHDRVTLAGTMLSLGPLYIALAWFGDRRGMHWARVALLTSAFVGFLSFFSFLGFGYFDPFHAFISAVLFQMTTLCLRSSQPACTVVEFDLRNSDAWRRAMWGQLLMVIQGFAILVGGIFISGFGVTIVFVEADLDFMQTTRDVLVTANPRLVPLVAHDRASFGGMLMSTGVTVLLTALWGWQRGRRWLWYTLAGTGTAAYGMTTLVHWHVGYTSLLHLLPAYGGFLLLWLGLVLSKQWMFEDASRDA